jgi:hypothetical protein
MASIQFTADEFELIKRQVEKLLDHKNKTKPRALRRKEEEYRILQSLLRKFHGPDIALRFDRRDLRGIQSICKIGANVIANSILPGYQDRVVKEVDESAKQKLQGYSDRAKETFKIYNQILSKIERQL